MENKTFAFAQIHSERRTRNRTELRPVLSFCCAKAEPGDRLENQLENDQLIGLHLCSKKNQNQNFQIQHDFVLFR